MTKGDGTGLQEEDEIPSFDADKGRVDALGLAKARGFAPSHPLTSRNVNVPVIATSPDPCIRASSTPTSPASLPSEYC